MVEILFYKEIIKKLTTAVLAGGKSKRFGSSKSSACLGNKNLFDISLKLAFKISNRVIVIRGNEDVPSPEYIKSFPDIHNNIGSLGGIHSALTFSETEYVAILPVDMPLLCPEIYKHLADSIKKDKPVAAISKKGLEPLVSIWSKQNLSFIEQLIKQKNLSIWNCIEKLNAVKVVFSIQYPEISDDCFYNINTKEDLELLKKTKSISK